MERGGEAERGKEAQLAYSFDIALQNEFSSRNIADSLKTVLFIGFLYA